MVKINPDILRQIITYLEAKYPNELPKTITTIERLHIQIGEQNVIRTLIEYLEYMERQNVKGKN